MLGFRRKYFSSSERLQIAQSAATNSSQNIPPSSPQHSHQAIDENSTESWNLQHTRQQSTKSLRSLTPVLGQSGLADGNVNHRNSPRVKRPQTSHAYDSARDSRTDSQWFTSLPEKIRRQHFSTEEQELLASGLDHWVTASRQGSKRNSRASSRRFSQSIAAVDCTKLEVDDMDGQLARAPSQLRDGMKRAFSSFH